MIFNLFKSKPTLKELIPKGFIDIHSHILPGIDDGAKNVEESKALLAEMQKMGFSKIIGTPHTFSGVYDNTTQSISESYKKLMVNKKQGVEIIYASEYMIEEEFLKKVHNRDILCLKNNYVLIEMSYISPPAILKETLFQLILNGYIPILAHPERYIFYEKNFDVFYDLKNRGCKFQINLLSLTGYYGKKSVFILKKLISNDLINFVGSDIHNLLQIEQFKNKIILNNNLQKKLTKVFEKNYEVFN